MFAPLLLIGSLLTGQVQAADQDALKVEVRQLVRQLNDDSKATRDAAEQKLVAKGPQVLELLPAVKESTPAEVKERLDRIRHQLQHMAAESATRASLITLQSPGMKLSQILAAIQKQSGNQIIDTRRQHGQPADDPELKVNFDKVPFWKALDEILDKAGLGVYAFGQQRAIHVVARQPQQAPRRSRASYSGPFRIEPVRLIASRDLRQPAGGALVLVVDVAWEPRLRPIGLKQRLADVVALDENGNSLAVDDRKAEVESLVQGDVTAVELEIPLILPPRRVRPDRQLQGQPPGHGAGKDRDLHLLGTAGRQERGKTHRRRHRHPGASPQEQRPLGGAHAGEVRRSWQLTGFLSRLDPAKRGVPRRPR